jgi:hypothetical protein
VGRSDHAELTRLDRTDSLNLFFCFRWILIAFKREFKFDQVIRLWEVGRDSGLGLASGPC